MIQWNIKCHKGDYCIILSSAKKGDYYTILSSVKWGEYSMDF